MAKKRIWLTISVVYMGASKPKVWIDRLEVNEISVGY